MNIRISEQINFCIDDIGELISRLEDLGREDAVHVLLGGCSLYRILTVEESMSPNSNSNSNSNSTPFLEKQISGQEATLNEECVSWKWR